MTITTSSGAGDLMPSVRVSSSRLRWRGRGGTAKVGLGVGSQNFMATAMRKMNTIRTRAPRSANFRVSPQRALICARRDLMARRAWLARVACHTKNPATIARTKAKAKKPIWEKDRVRLPHGTILRSVSEGQVWPSCPERPAAQ